MNDIKKMYYNKANNLFSRLMDEADEPETEATPEGDEATADAETPEKTPEAEEQGQAQKVEIYYNNLNEETQIVLMDALKESLNATKDDKIAAEKLEETLSKEPLVTLMADELIRKLKIEI